MTANSSTLGHVSYATEASFGEESTTFGTRLPVMEMPDPSGLTQEMLDVPIVTQYQNDGHRGIRGVQSGQFTLRFRLTGHGSTTAAAVSATALGTFLGHVFGNSTTRAGDIIATASSSSVFDATTGPYSDGEMFRLGALGDARGGGQFGVVGDYTTKTITSLLALGATPNAADVLYGCEMVYPHESPTAATVQSLRFLIATANQRYEAHGCVPVSASINVAPNEVPTIDVTFQAAWFREEASSTFPSVTAHDTFYPAPAAGGSLFLQVAGTTTRATYNALSVSMGLDLGVVPIMATGGAQSHQAMIGARRTQCRASLSMTVDAEAATATPAWSTAWNTAEASRNAYHAMYTLSSGNGSAVGIYFPRLELTGARPMQTNVDGLNRVAVNFRALTSSVTTSALTLSSWRLALA